MLLRMEEPHDRLRRAREAAGIPTPTEAAKRFGWPISTYLSHENGHRGFKPPSAEKYARRLGVGPEYLLFGKKAPVEREAAQAERPTVPLVGHVAAGAEAYFYTGDQGELDRVPAPDGYTESTVAVEIRGDSLGSFFDHWLVFYDDVRRPVTQDLVGKPCVVGLADGRVLIKKIQRSRTRGLFHLLSNVEPPILDVSIEWAARIKNMVPR